MNWPQWKINTDQERESLAKDITIENFKAKLEGKQVFYDKESCGSAIEFDSIGEPVDGEIVAKLTRELRDIKIKAEQIDGGLQEKKRKFDSLASEKIHEASIPDHQGWNPRVWVFLQMSLFDVVHWRWASEPEIKGAWNHKEEKKNIQWNDRLFSQPINRGCLSRLWLWNKILIDTKQLGKERSLIESLQEDNKVAIIERTTVSSDGRLALAIARRHLSKAKPDPTQVLRRVMKLVILKMACIETMSLDDSQLNDFVEKCFAEAEDDDKWQ